MDDYKKRIIARADIGPRPGDLEHVYWIDSGGLSAYDLRIIADELDRRNSQPPKAEDLFLPDPYPSDKFATVQEMLDAMSPELAEEHRRHMARPIVRLKKWLAVRLSVFRSLWRKS